MLPFDLHVLGLPPAFTLSQDQTLHLKFSRTNPLMLRNAEPDQTQLLAVRCTCVQILIRIEVLFRTSAMDNHPSPDARTSHLRTLSKIFGAGLSAFPVSPQRRSVRVSRPSYRGLHCCQHPVTNFFSRPASGEPAARGPRIIPGLQPLSTPGSPRFPAPPPQSPAAARARIFTPFQGIGKS